jgi:hypothetical protein
MTDDDALDRDDRDATGGWVSLADAAADCGCDEAWLLDRCRDGRLPSRPGPGAEAESGRVVPLATARALVEGHISD